MPGFGGSKPKAVPVAPPAPVMPGMNSLFQNLFGAAGATGINALSGAAAGTGFGASTVTPDMIAAIRKGAAANQQAGFGAIQSKFAASGMSMSSDLMSALAKYNVDYGAQTDATVAQLQFQGAESAANRQFAASNILEETFSNAAMTFAPTQMIGQQQGSNIGGAAVEGGSAIISAMIMAGMMCWIAERLYGKNDSRTYLLRYWLNHEFKHRWVVNLYRKYGKKAARSKLVFLLKPLFDLAVRRASRWRESWQVQVQFQG